MEQVLEWVKTILTFLSPLAVVIVSANIERRQRKEKEKKDEQAKADAEHDKEMKDAIKALSDKVDDLSTKVDGFESSIQGLQACDRSVKEALRNLSQSLQITAEYDHKQAALVMTLAEGMRDQHLDGNITRAIAALRSYEHDTLTKLTQQMTQSPTDD